MSRVWDNNSFWDKLLLAVALKTKDTCRGIIDSRMIIIQSRTSQDFATL